MKVPVLGGRPAGTTTALQADELGPDITLVEVKRLGGTSLNEGSAPDSRRGARAHLRRAARPDRLPASVVVIASADTGCQLASILGAFGAQVTLVEASPRSRSARGRLAQVQTPSSASSRPDRIALTNAS